MKLLPLHPMALSSLVAVTASVLVSSSVQAGSSSSSTSFVRDVMGQKKIPTTGRIGSLNDNLLAKAVPLDQYKARLRTQGLRLQEDVVVDEPMPSSSKSMSRQLDEQAAYYYYYYNDDGNGNGNNNNNQQQQDQYAGDDYYVSQDDYMSFSGFALKYAKCQPVQHFSSNAVNSGEYSPMVLDDIVILRLCPSFYCSDSSTYGCSYDYADYAIRLTDYIRTMLRYKIDKEEELCYYCQNCDGSYADACIDYSEYCFDSDGNPICNDNGNDDNNAEEGGEDGNDDGSSSYALDAAGYLDIIDCVQVDGGYFIRPRCDGYTEELTMGVYHDKFCSQYAGDSFDISNFNLGVDQSYFEEFGSSTGCLDCSETDYPPYFNANSNLCNRLDISGARCTSNLESNLFYNATDDDSSSSSSSSSSSDSAECLYIDSLQSGMYDEKGQLYNSESLSTSRSITQQQKILLSVALVICILLGIYACYLHHAITNLLIKSLSHSDLLPPSSRGSRRKSPRPSSSSSRRRSSSRNRRSSRRHMTDDEDDEEFEMKRGATNA